MNAARWSAFALATIVACDQDAASPGVPCLETTSSVTATITVGSSVVFDWSPRCAVALLLVEQEGADQWAIAAPFLGSATTPETGNIILPPVTYGQAPPDAEETDPPQSLVAGVSYELVLWKILPSGSTVTCMQNFENGCHLTSRTFVR